MAIKAMEAIRRPAPRIESDATLMIVEVTHNRRHVPEGDHPGHPGPQPIANASAVVMVATPAARRLVHRDQRDPADRPHRRVTRQDSGESGCRELVFADGALARSCSP